mmetsp:Transcript_107113/g.160151  ORF Transcript_107113/g.160151 Transcript_107113/m.160151 type:complete len:99 (-) Transcript_107113:129-425(-)
MSLLDPHSSSCCGPMFKCTDCSYRYQDDEDEEPFSLLSSAPIEAVAARASHCGRFGDNKSNDTVDVDENDDANGPSCRSEVGDFKAITAWESAMVALP